ncbi:MAG: molybdopterin molybdenumtransferase MoeA [Gammaproteobacteria bacterium]|jgi:molybdopterin molybdotransferase|nr:molybdopterin molybdenumtransferase MoeA [Gammaproteobacteria bacterium]
MSSKTNADCCADGHEGPALKLSEALSRILAEVQPVSGGDTLAVRSALGRVLSADVVSSIDVPSHTNSAMDGYALAGSELSAGGETRLEVIGTSAAGRPFAGEVRSGQCVRIMTGAPMPPGADTVAMQENVVRDGDIAIVGPGQKVGQHVRQAGEDIAAGTIALAAGTRLMPAEIGILGSLGVGEVRVRRRPRVAFFSTGDELRSVGEPLGEGQIYDSNRYTIFGMLSRLGVDVLDMGVIRDDRDAVEQAFAKAAAEADAIVSSGGVSVGDADYVAETLERTGTVGFWKVAMKPGRPLAFGRIGEALFFGLPGNPNSVMVTFYQLVQPALQALAGIPNPEPPLTMPAISATALHKKPGRREFQRGVFSRSEDGRLVVRKTGHQGSGVLSSMAAANCFIVLPEDSGPVAEGDEVTVQPFAAFV